MTSPEEITKIADTRLEEAKILLEKGKFSGAFYLAGYSVELYLKAKICRVFGIPDLFVENKSKLEGIDDIRRAVKTHKLFVLLTFSGLKSKYKLLKDNNSEMFDNISPLLKDWNETERYKLDNPIRHKQIKNMLNYLEEFLKWIEIS